MDDKKNIGAKLVSLPAQDCEYWTSDCCSPIAMQVESNNMLQEGWLPVALIFRGAKISVRWVDFGSKGISEPFFTQTLRELRSRRPPAREQVTELSALEEASANLPPAHLAGIIFHVSRCGSTLLANAMRAPGDVCVLSEAHIIGGCFPHVVEETVFDTPQWMHSRKRLLDAVLRIYANYDMKEGGRVVIKTHAASLLRISDYRAVWPEAPFVIVIRDPAEVIVSNLMRPGAWVKSRLGPLQGRTVFGWKISETQHMSIEEYCARGIGAFCEAALEHIDGRCEVVDYAGLDPERIYDVAALFGVKLPPAESIQIRRVMGSYSKNVRSDLMFQRDSERKQREVTSLLRDEVARWAREPYQGLRALDSRFARTVGNLEINTEGCASGIGECC